MSSLAMLMAAIASSGAPAAAQTALSFLCVSPDITVALTSGTVTPQQVQCYALPSGTLTIIFVGIPKGVNITGYFPISATQNLLTIDTTAALPINGVGGTVTVTPRDVASYDTSISFFSSSIFFAGAGHGVPDGTRIDAVGMDISGNLLLSFDATVSLPKTGGGALTVKPADLVSFNGATYLLAFDSVLAGIPDGTNLDGATMLPNAHLMMAFDVSGSIGGVDFTPERVLEFNPGDSSWVLSFDGISADNWPEGSAVQGVLALAATATATSTPTPTATPTATATATVTATPTPVPVTLKIKPNALKFPMTTVGTPSKPKTVKISNPKGNKKHPGQSVLIEMISDPDVFTETNDCPASLAAGSACSIFVTFTPNAPTGQTGTLTITDNAIGHQQNVQLSGTGKAAK